MIREPQLGEGDSSRGPASAISARPIWDVCLFSHFDSANKVDRHVLRYLQEIKRLNFSIVFISASALTPADVARLRVDCYDVILRENNGLDFASWSAGFAKHGVSIGGRLLLANDSVYGPVGCLATAFKRLTRKPADFYGMVESVENEAHLQSWFLLFEPWVVGNPEFRAILAQPFSAMSKRKIVSDGEAGITRRLTMAGFRYRSLYSHHRITGLPRRHDANPMLLFWRETLLDGGVPFLKIELLRDNPLQSADIPTILRTVEAIEPSLCGLIKSHLAHARRRPQRSVLARARYTMIRRRCDFGHIDGLGSRVLNRISLELLSALVWGWRFVQKLYPAAGVSFRSRPRRCVDPELTGLGQFGRP